MFSNKAWLLLLLIPVILIFTAYKSGSPGGYSGSAGDKGSTCVKCHTSSATITSGWIITNIPSTGYLSDQVYVITLTASDPTAKLFGFELTAEDNSGVKSGTFNVVNSPGTKLVNANKSVTHTSTGTATTENLKIWNIEWTAPSETAGTINFFAAINAANGNGTNSGDVIYKTSASVTPAVTGIEILKNSVQLYPNPTSGIVNIDISGQSAQVDLEIWNYQGQLEDHIVINNGSNQINLSHLPKGLYILKMSSGNSKRVDKLFVY